MGKVFFGTMDGEVLGELDTISEIELTAESTEEDEMGFISRGTEEMTFECQIDDWEQFEKHVVYGGNKGRYNGHILKKDGYLSPENAWI